MRELLVVSGGNEAAIGLALAAWLLWTAAGSAVVGKTGRRNRLPHLMPLLESALALILPLTVTGIRDSRTVLQTVPGESLGPAAAMLVSFVALGPVCFVSGALFSAGSRLQGARAAEATTAVYILEALGSAAGGVAAGLALIGHATGLQIAWALAGLNLWAAFGLGFRSIAPWVAAIGLVAITWLPRSSLPPGRRLLTARESPYGSLAVVETGGIRSLYENGLALIHSPDPEAAEEAVHYALLEHPAPRSLLLIGGSGATIAQALRHPSLVSLDYVEIDPGILDLTRRYFPEQSQDSRVRVHVADGRRFVKTAKNAYDVIIVNLPDPQTAQLNRFFTLEFFREAARKMGDGGVFSFRLAGSENFISPARAEFLRSIAKTLRMAFADVVVIPGESVHFFAATRPGVLTRDPEQLLTRLRERRIETEYVREYYVPFRMAPEKMAALEAQIRPDAATRVNRDFTPVAYYFNVALWSSQFGQRYATFFRGMAGVPFWVLAAALGVVVCGAIQRTGAGNRAPAVLACVFAMGFTLMGLEIMLLLGFQAIHGYVYQQMAILIAAFMLGMASGAGLPDRNGLVTTQVFAASAPLTLFALLQFSPPAFLFPALAFVCGMLGGYQFRIASRIFFADKTGALGALYAIDLAGSCLGAILFSAWLIPVFGFFKTAILAAELNLAPLALAIRRRPGQ